jgi:ABC-type antimicrobial peptide transport system permease subunit
MIGNYIKVTLRNIFKYKSYTIINILGLAIGMACTILILIWVQDELSYDRFHTNADELYRVVVEDHESQQVSRFCETPPPLSAALKQEFPGIIQTTRFGRWGRQLVKHGEKRFNENGLCFADAAIFKMFTFTFIKGDPQTVFINPYSIVLTEEMVEKYFGNEDPINKSLNINDRFNLKITGVIKSIPANSHLKFDFLTQFETIKELIGAKNLNNWEFHAFGTYVLLTPNTDVGKVNQKISGFLEKNSRGQTRLYLQPLTEIHLYGLEGDGTIVYVYIFSLVALFVLVIACLNFMNLSTARSFNRIKEVGVRKVVGATRAQLIMQFLGEAIFLVFIANLIAIILVQLALPAFNQLSGKRLTIDYPDYGTILGLIAIVIITGLISGSYPALFLSSSKPAEVLKGKIKSASYKLRRVLVVVQISLSIILIICTLVVSNQLNYLSTKKLGFDKNNLVYFSMNRAFRNNYEALRNELLKSPDILNVTATSNLPIDGVNATDSKDVDWEGKRADKKIRINHISVDYDFIETFNIKFVQGRNFSRSFSTDPSNYIVNEKAVEQMGMEFPIGKQFSFWKNRGEIIGVVKDFNFDTLYDEIEPLLLRMAPDWYFFVVVKIKAARVSNSLDILEKIYRKFAPGFPVEYSFLEERIKNLYRDEDRMEKIISSFAFLAIFVSCLGLFGLSSFMAEKRTKEIGIRKVLGASTSGIVFLLSKEFVKVVFIANIVAWPIAYYAMNRWLQDFAYRTNMSVTIFIFSTIFTLVITLLTVSYQCIRASTIIPVEALKYE